MTDLPTANSAGASISTSTCVAPLVIPAGAVRGARSATHPAASSKQQKHRNRQVARSTEQPVTGNMHRVETDGGSKGGRDRTEQQQLAPDRTKILKP
jgi:hypothetical protein